MELRAAVHEAVDILVDFLHEVKSAVEEKDVPAANTTTPEANPAPTQSDAPVAPAEVETPAEDTGEVEETPTAPVVPEAPAPPAEVANTPVGVAPVPPADPNVGNQPIAVQ